MTRPHKLTALQKAFAVDQVLAKHMTVTELAVMYRVHPRTIYRAMEEAGHGTAQTDRKMSPGKKALEIMAKYGISVEQLEGVLIQATTFTIPKAPRAPSKAAALFHPAPTVAMN